MVSSASRPSSSSSSRSSMLATSNSSNLIRCFQREGFLSSSSASPWSASQRFCKVLRMAKMELTKRRCITCNANETWMFLVSLASIFLWVRYSVTASYRSFSSVVRLKLAVFVWRSLYNGLPFQSFMSSFNRRMKNLLVPFIPSSLTRSVARSAVEKMSSSSSCRRRLKVSLRPLWGVAVRSNKCSHCWERMWAASYRFDLYSLSPYSYADSLCASSKTIKSQDVLLTICMMSSRHIKSIDVTIWSLVWKMVGSDMKTSLLTNLNGMLNLMPISSSCHCLVKPPGVTIRMRSTIFRMMRSSPVIMVLPAPVSSARRKRIWGWGRRYLYTASTWCGRGSTILQLMANKGSNWYADLIRSASANRTNFSGSPLKLNSPSEVSTSSDSICCSSRILDARLLLLTPV